MLRKTPSRTNYLPREVINSDDFKLGCRLFKDGHGFNIRLEEASSFEIHRDQIAGLSLMCSPGSWSRDLASASLGIAYSGLLWHSHNSWQARRCPFYSASRNKTPRLHNCKWRHSWSLHCCPYLMHTKASSQHHTTAVPSGQYTPHFTHEKTEIGRDRTSYPSDP